MTVPGLETQVRRGGQRTTHSRNPIECSHQRMWGAYRIMPAERKSSGFTAAADQEASKTTYEDTTVVVGIVVSRFRKIRG